MAVKLNSKGKTHASSLIDSGKVDKDSSWSFSAEDGNKILGDPPDWSAYSKMHLGIDSDANQESKDAYHYPFGKDGKVYRSGLIAIRQRASAQGATDIYDAAGALIDKIDGKTSNLSPKITNRSLFKPRAKGIYKIDNKSAADEVTVYLYDEISWWGISSEQFVKDLNSITASTIHLRFNSPGGSVFDGMAIYNAVTQHKSNVIGHVDGLAASIASVILMGCNEIRMGVGAFLMIHEPWSLVVGGAEDMRKEADLLDKVSGTIVDILAKRYNKTSDELTQMMSDETWMTSQEAIDCGFADCMDNSDTPAKAQSTSVLFNLSAFFNVPEALKDQKIQPTARDCERILRDAGCTRHQAKSIVAEGYKDNQRDVEDSVSDPPDDTQRDVVIPPAVKKDRMADLLTKAEMIIPSTK